MPAVHGTRKRRRAQSSEEGETEISSNTTHCAAQWFAIGLVSDTHGVLDDAMLDTLRKEGVVHIIHAGDVGPGRAAGKKRLPAGAVIEALRDIAAVSAITGNVDEEDSSLIVASQTSTRTSSGDDSRQTCSHLSEAPFPVTCTSEATLRVEPLPGLTAWVTHGHKVMMPSSGSPPSLSVEVQSLIQEAEADVVVWGHSHRPVRALWEGNVLINPGSAGPKRFSLPRCFAVLHLKSCANVGPLEEKKSRGSADIDESRCRHMQDNGADGRSLRYSPCKLIVSLYEIDGGTCRVRERMSLERHDHGVWRTCSRD